MIRGKSGKPQLRIIFQPLSRRKIKIWQKLLLSSHRPVAKASIDHPAMGSDTTERILEKKYKLSKSVAKEVAAEARELLDLEKSVLWSKALERECILITDARGLTKDGAPAPKKKQYYTLAGELLEPIVEDDSVPKKLRRSSRCNPNPKSCIRRSNSDPEGKTTTPRIGRSEWLRASRSCRDLNMTGESALQGFFTNVLGGGTKLLLVQDNARGIRLSECDLKSITTACTTMSAFSDDLSNASSTASGWRWGSQTKTTDTLSTMSLGTDDLDDDDEVCSFRQLSVRFNLSQTKLKSATEAPKVPRRRGSFEGEIPCMDCPPPSTVVVRTN